MCKIFSFHALVLTTRKIDELQLACYFSSSFQNIKVLLRLKKIYQNISLRHSIVFFEIMKKKPFIFHSTLLFDK